MHPLAERVRRTVNRFALLPAGSRVVVALSGGADSVALTRLLGELARPLDVTIAGLAHLNHQLRGEAADRDEAFCRAVADALGAAIDVERIDVGALARSRHESTEEAGRFARYQFLARAAERLAADRIAVGHTCDDQAETLLLRLLRGAGPRGLAGIYPKFGSIVRPLLEVTHADLVGYLGDLGQSFCEDETNADQSIPRNRVRHRLIPMLAREFSPGIVEVLAREAAIARDDAAWLEQAAREAAAGVIRPTPEGSVVEVPGLLALPPALARRVLVEALDRGAGGRMIAFSHAEALLALAAGPEDGAPVDLPGQRARRAGHQLILRPRGPGPTRHPGETNFFRYSLSTPGEAVVPEAGCTVTAEPAPVQASHGNLGWLGAGASGEAVVDAAKIVPPLAVRNRRPGDRFRPLGLDGHKKLQDLFVDRKVPSDVRDRVPLVVDETDRVVWVVGHGIDAHFKVTDGTKSVVILKLKELGAAR